MKRPLLVPAGLALSVLVTACGDTSSGTPTAPSEVLALRSAAPKPPPQNSARGSVITGSISMIGSSPGSPASLLVGECRFGNVSRVCADGWRGTFDVWLDRDMVWAVLSVGFYEGTVPCGYAADVVERVSAGQTVTFRPSWISLSDEFGFSSPCRLPATTTRMVAVLWSDADWSTQLTQEFPGSYTFVRP